MPAKNLGQVEGSGSLAAAYTVAASKTATVSSCVIVNTTASAATVVVKLAVANAADAVKQTLFNGSVPANSRIAISEAWTAAATDVFKVNAPTGVAVNIFGSEG